MQATPNLAKAIISVMQSVKGIEKSMTVGTGSNAYKGVSDKDVKNILGDAMADNGLCILPIDTDAKIQIDRWEETGGQYGPKQKQSVFTEVKTKYLLLHESGESMELSGYGHGIDSQDKGAGKATTYALKYTLLYLFLVPTGKIDDADNSHSDSYETPKNVKQVFEQVPTPGERQILRDMVFKSTLDEAQRLATLEKIENCMTYKQYAIYQAKLESVQAGFNDVVNPNQKDINKEVKRIVGKHPDGKPAPVRNKLGDVVEVDEVPF